MGKAEIEAPDDAPGDDDVVADDVVAGDVVADDAVADDAEQDGPPRAMLIAAVVLAVAATVAVLVVVVTKAQRAPEAPPVAIAAFPAPQASSPDCERLIAALPGQLGDFGRVTPADPVPAGTAAWTTADGGEPVVLRCGLDRPADFVIGAPIQVVNAVQWFQAPETATEPPPADAPAQGYRSTWYTVDRPVYVALTLPPASGPTPIQLMSDLIATTLPAVDIQPGPAR